jgi:hypothetical protein
MVAISLAHYYHLLLLCMLLFSFALFVYMLIDLLSPVSTLYLFFSLLLYIYLCING